MIRNREFRPSEPAPGKSPPWSARGLILCCFGSVCLLVLSDLFSSGPTLIFILIFNPNAVAASTGQSLPGYDVATSANLIRVSAWISAVLGLLMFVAGMSLALYGLKLGKNAITKALPALLSLFCCSWLIFGAIHRTDAAHMRNSSPLPAPPANH